MRTQRALGVAKEVLPNLCLSELLQVGFIPIDAATGLVELDDGYDLACAGFLSIESSEHVAVESLGTKHDYYADCITVSWKSNIGRANHNLPENSETMC